MLLLVVLLFLSLTLLATSIFLLGFRLGGDHWQRELLRVRTTAAQAQRQLHDLTRQAFVAMAEEAQRHRTGS
jgi:hypothetical protein